MIVDYFVLELFVIWKNNYFVVKGNWSKFHYISISFINDIYKWMNIFFKFEIKKYIYYYLYKIYSFRRYQ